MDGERPRDQVRDQGSDKGSRIRTQVRDPGHRFQDQRSIEELYRIGRG